MTTEQTWTVGESVRGNLGENIRLVGTVLQIELDGTIRVRWTGGCGDGWYAPNDSSLQKQNDDYKLGEANARLIADAPLMAERIEQTCQLVAKWLAQAESSEVVLGQLTDVLAPWA